MRGSAIARQRHGSASKRQPNREVHGAPFLVQFRHGIYADIEADGAEGEGVTQAGADRVSHFVEADVLVLSGEVAGIDEEGAAQGVLEREGELGVEDGEGLAAGRIAVRLARAELALAEGAHAVGAAVEKSLVNRHFREGQDDAAARAQSEDVARRKDLRKVRHARARAGKGEFAGDGAGVEPRRDDVPFDRILARLTEVEGLREAERDDLIGRRPEIDGVDDLAADVDVLALEKRAELHVGVQLAREVGPETLFAFVVAQLGAGLREEARAQAEFALEKPLIDIEQLRLEAAL